MMGMWPSINVSIIVISFGLVVFLHARQLSQLDEDPSEIFERLGRLQQHVLVPYYIDMLLFNVLLFLVTLIHSASKYFKISTPDFVFAMMIGYVLGILAFHSDVFFLATHFKSLSVNDIFYVFIPVTVFTLSFCLDFQLFLKTISQILVIGIPVCFCTAYLFGELTKLVLRPNNFSGTTGFEMGLLTIPIYPKKLAKMLKNDTNKSKHISLLLEAEALITIVILDVSKELIRGNYLFDHEWYHFFLVILRFVVLGSFSGFLFGLLGKHLLRKLYTNQISIFLVCFILPFLAYCVSEDFVSGCGSITVMVMGVMLSMERAILGKDTENLVINFWECACYILNMAMALRCAMRVACFVTPVMKGKHYAVLLVVFVLYYGLRFLSFLIFSPVLSRVGYGMDIKSMLVCVWAGIKSPFSTEVILFLQEYAAERDPAVGTDIYFHAAALLFFSLLVNGTFSPLVINFLGLQRVSMARQLNMNNCIKHIFEKRERTIAVLKTDRFLADTNWPMVIEATDIKHPYETKIESEDEIDLLVGYRFTQCTDCKKNIPLKPTEKEMKDMIREAKMRILKAKQMSYSRQYESGMISNEGIRILSQAVELAMDSEDCTMKISDLAKLFVEEGCFHRLIRKRAEMLDQRKKNAPKPPRTYWRRICYNQIVKKSTFDKIMLGIVLVNVVTISLELHYYPSIMNWKPIEHDLFVDYILLVFRIVFTLIYIIESLMRILAFSHVSICRDGLRRYFKDVWYIIDVATILGFLLSLSMSLLDVIKQFKFTQEDFNHSIFRQTIDALVLLRVLRIFRVFDIFYPDCIAYLNKAAANKMAFTYELGKSYANGETEVLDKLPYMIDNKEIRNDMKAAIEADRLLITKLLGTVQKERPWIAITVKTKQAIRTILCSMNEAMYSLKSAGWIDIYEYEKLQAAMNLLYKNVNSIKKVDPNPPKVIFEEVSWMSGDEVVIDFLFENVTVKTFEPGDVVFTEGIVADGIYVVVTGLFLLTYKPELGVLNSLHEYGELPIVDYLSGTKYQEEAVDYIVSGNCIGELSTLTGRPYNCVITADTHSQVYVLNCSVLKRAMELSPDPVTGLKCRIWKEVSQRIALPLLLSVPAYQALSQDQIKYALERAFVPDLSNYKIFAVTDVIEEIVLIEGVAADYNTREIFIAPCCIPRNVQRLILPKSSLMNTSIAIETKLMIIPEKDVDGYDVMLTAEETCQLVNSGSALKCLQHAVQERMEKRPQMRSWIRRRRRRVDHSDTVSTRTSLGTSAETRSRLTQKFSPLSFKSKATEFDSVNLEDMEAETEKRDFNYEEPPPSPPPPQPAAKRRQSVFYM